MKIQQIISPSLGNVLEWFDFGLFVYLAPIIGEKFFPAHDQNAATLSAFGVFAAGFICRPIGGIVFGYLGDKFGRVNALRLSIFSIALATLFVSLLPTYSTAGVFAATLFTLLRLAQGLSVGGEYAGAAVYITESAPDKLKGFMTSFAACGANLGFLLATLAAIILKTTISEKSVEQWAWRLPFFFSGVLGLVILHYRLKMIETTVYNTLKSRQRLQKNPLLTTFKKSPLTVLKIVGLTCMGSTLYFIFFGYMPIYLSKTAQMPLAESLSFQAVLLCLMMLLIPLFGWIGDHFGRKKILSTTAISIVVLAIPCFYLLEKHSVFSILCALTIATVLSAAEQGNTLTAANENSMASIRYTCVSFSFNLGNAVFGGTAPLIVSLIMKKGNYFLPAYYLMAMALLTWFATLGLKKMKFT